MQPRTLKIVVGLIVVAVIGTAVVLRMRVVEVGPIVKKQEVAGKPLEEARALVRNPTDLERCMMVRARLNDHLANNPDLRSDALPDDLSQRLALDEAETLELKQSTFSALDAVHLDAALLFRNAAAHILTRDADRQRPVEEEAAVAFAWTCRQIALDPNALALDASQEVLVPQLALQRGYGSPLMRALVFLRLLEQLRHDGCLLALPGRSADKPKYWACGVLSGDRVYLFDPRLGLPLPGPDGKGIATLDQLRQKDSPVLKQLDLGMGARYDITAESAAGSEIHLAPTLSALAPRQRLLEKELLPDAGRLSFDIAAVSARFQKVGQGGAVQVPGWALRLERKFFGPQQGGVDDQGKLEKFRQSLLHSSRGPSGLTSFHLALPAQLRQIPMTGTPLEILFYRFHKSLLDFTLAPDQPRVQLLHGRLSDAGGDLGRRLETLEPQRRGLTNRFNARKFIDWFSEAEKGEHGKMTREDFENVEAFVDGVTAQELLPRVAYLTALVKHEQAEFERQELGLLKMPTPVDLEKVQKTWNDAVSFWDRSVRDPSPMHPHALWMRALSEHQRARLAQDAAALTPGDARLKEQADELTKTAGQQWQKFLEQGERPPLVVLAVKLQLRELEKPR